MTAGPELLLLPTPKRTIRTGGWIHLPGPTIGPNPDSLFGVQWLSVQIKDDGAASDESYELEVGRIGGAEPSDPVRVRITAHARVGAGHAMHTLAQLIRRFGRRLPCARIEDRPVFPVRGVMLDISRCRVPTMVHLLEVVDLLASLKFNHLQLYTEHTFAYAGHEPVWRGCSPMTPDEVRRLDERCRARGIVLAANQNCFGHLNRWLSLPEYASLAETHGPWTFMGQPRHGPFTLCPEDPRSVQFVAGLLDQLLPCFSSGLVNIGCDETHDVGLGRSAQRVQRIGRGAVYADFVGRIARECRDRGFRPMFWADMALREPGVAATLPDEMIALAWGYEPGSDFGSWGRRLGEAGLETWICPGTSSWRSITGRTSERRGNIARAAAEGAEHGATGLLVTDWGDLGHHQQWAISLIGLAQAAQAAWNPATAREYDARAASLHVFGDRSLRVGPWLESLGDVDLPLRRIGGRSVSEATRDNPFTRAGRPCHLREPVPLTNASALFTDLFTPFGEPWLPDTLRMWREVRGRLADFERSIPSGLGALLEDELVQTVHLARLAADRAILRRGGPGSASAVAQNLRRAIAEHRRLWMIRSRGGGLDQSVAYLDRVLGDLPRTIGS